MTLEKCRERRSWCRGCRARWRGKRLASWRILPARTLRRSGLLFGAGLFPGNKCVHVEQRLHVLHRSALRQLPDECSCARQFAQYWFIRTARSRFSALSFRNL